MSRRRTVARWALGVLVAVGLLGMVDRTMAQDQPAAEPRTFGTASTVAHTIQAYAFRTLEDTVLFDGVDLQGALGCGGIVCTFVAPVLLPAGAAVLSIQLEACDTDGAQDVLVELLRVRAPGAATEKLGDATTTDTPGCVLITENLTTPETINNQTYSYFLRVVPGSLAFTSHFFSVRIFYRLQVSPAPAVASFGDVPTSHPFFQFVEALKASGITGGCQAAPPLFCPDAPLTRGQMATFLSLALGLHFAP